MEEEESVQFPGSHFPCPQSAVFFGVFGFFEEDDEEEDDDEEEEEEEDEEDGAIVFSHSPTETDLAPFIVSSRFIQSIQCSSIASTAGLMYRVGGRPGSVSHFFVPKNLQ